MLGYLDEKVVFKGKRSNNVYTIDLHSLTNQNVRCLVSFSNDAWLWHRRLGHASMSLLENLSKGELVRDLPKIKFFKDKMCDACQMGKQAKSSFKPKNQVSTSRPLELLHMDLVGPSQVSSLSEKHYTYVIVDDYSRFYWLAFLTHKNDAFEAFKSFAKCVQNEKRIFHNLFEE